VYGPDGTLFALTRRSGELWAYPASGTDRVLVARKTADNGLEGWLGVSPDGRGLAVMGLSDPTLFKVGSFTPVAGKTPTAKQCSLLPEWEDYRFPKLYFYDRTCFTRDSAFWVGRTHDSIVSHKDRFRCWRLPDLTTFEYKGFPVPNCLHMAAGPGPSQFVIAGWSVEHDAVAYWCADLARPDVPVTAPVGTTKECNGLEIGSDGRFYVTNHGVVWVYSVGKRGFRLDLTVKLPHFTGVPKLSLSADARRFVAHCFQSKLVCAADTRTGEVLGPWDWEIGQVHDAAIAPDGLTAAAAGSSKKLVFWDLDG
jgi:hypothetical protein